MKYNSDNEIIAYKNGVCGIITIKQEVVLQLEYTKIYKFCDDIWYAFKGDNEGVIEVGDTRVIVPCEFKSVDRISNFFSAISHQDKVKLYDESGIEVTLPFEYDGIRWLFADKFEVTNNSFKGIISIKSEGENYIVTPITDIRYSSISKFENGFAIVTNAQKWEGFINEDGEQIGSMNFESVRPFTNDLAAVEMHRSQKTVWGFIDTSGEIVIPYIYDKVKDFKEFEYTSVCKDGKWTVIDRQGNEVIPCIYDEVTSIQYHKRQELLYVHVTLDGYEGLIEVKTAIDEE